MLPSPAPTSVSTAAPQAAIVADLPHPALWRAHQLGAARAAVTPSGFERLDAELPGGGWPHRGLTELLLPHPGVGELRLLAPALAAPAASAGGPAAAGPALLLAPPGALSGWALAALGIAPQRLLWLEPAGLPGGCDDMRVDARADARTDARSDALWALEQALLSGHLGPVLAWWPGVLRADALRRLQLAAQAHDAPVFLLRGSAARARTSPAPLRLALQPVGIDRLALHLFKRRGPPLPHPLLIDLPPVLGERERRRLQQRRVRLPALGAPAPLPAPASSPHAARAAAGVA